MKEKVWRKENRLEAGRRASCLDYVYKRTGENEEGSGLGRYASCFIANFTEVKSVHPGSRTIVNSAIALYLC